MPLARRRSVGGVSSYLICPRTAARRTEGFVQGFSGRRQDLEAAYRRLARSMHPDKNGGTEALALFALMTL